MLSEYLESVVPVLYANYIVVMVRLPSARYHLEMDGISHDNVSEKSKRSLPTPSLNLYLS